MYKYLVRTGTKAVRSTGTIYEVIDYTEYNCSPSTVRNTWYIATYEIHRTPGHQDSGDRIL